MPPRHILSPQSRVALFDPPTDPAAIVRHYTFSPEDMALIRLRRRAPNRIGFAVNLAYLRFPGRVLGVEEIRPSICSPSSLGRLDARPQNSACTHNTAKHVENISGSSKPLSAFVPFAVMTSALLFMSRSNRRPDRIAATSSCPR